MVKALTYDIPDHKIKLKIREFQVMGKNTRQINNTGFLYVYIAPCSTIQSAEQILLQPKFHGHHTIDKMINVTELCKGKYPDVRLYISGITPIRDSLNQKVKNISRLLKDNIHRKKLLNIFFTDNDNLDNEELFYDNKHLKKDSGVRILASNFKRSVLKGTSKQYDYNYRKIKQHSFKESKPEGSVNKDPPQSRSIEMVQVRSPTIQVSSDDPKVQSVSRDPIEKYWIMQLKQMNSPMNTV